MKRKFWTLLFVMCIILPCSIALASCGSSADPEVTVGEASYTGTAYIDEAFGVTPTATVTYGEETVDGTWSFVGGQTWASTTTYSIKFTPSDAEKYSGEDFNNITTTVTISEYTFKADYEIAQGDTLTIATGTTLVIPTTTTLTNNGTIVNNGTLAVSNEAGLDLAYTIGGNVKLLDSITLNTRDYIGDENGTTSISVVLDFNGKTITETTFLDGTATKLYNTTVYKNSSLTLTDSTGNGKITATANTTNAVFTVDGILNVNGGTIECVGSYGIYCRNDGAVYVNDGTIISKGLYDTDGTLLSANSAMSGNNTTGNMNFYIYGGTVTAEVCTAIYMPGQTDLVVTGGTINGGIVARMGQISISGGTINGLDSEVVTLQSISSYYGVTDHITLGNALSVLAGTYSSSHATYGNSCNITITGGTLNGLTQKAIVIYDIATNHDQAVTLTISGDATIYDNEVNQQSVYVYKVYEDANVSYSASKTLTLSISIGGSEQELVSTSNLTCLYYVQTKENNG